MGYHGKSARFDIDTTGDTLTNISTGGLDIDFPTSIKTAEVTGFSEDNEVHVKGTRGRTITIGGNLTTTVDDVLSRLENVSTAINFEYYPISSGSGKPLRKGECYITSYDVKSPASGPVGYTASFLVTGGITSTTVA